MFNLKVANDGQGEKVSLLAGFVVLDESDKMKRNPNPTPEELESLIDKMEKTIEALRRG